MSTVIFFVDVLAYSGSALGALLLLWIGSMLIRPGGAIACLSIMITDERALQCVREGAFRPHRARAFGGLFLLFASLMFTCIVRGFAHH